MMPTPATVAKPDRAEAAPYWHAIERLDHLIDPAGPTDRSLAAIWNRAEQKLHRARRFLAFLGNPHRRFPVVHVTGTSGKGSTCSAISSVLTAAGHRVGLATSPYLQVATEKLQINGQLIGAQQFAELAEEVLAAAADFQHREDLERPLAYGEIWVAMMAVWFASQRVDIAVVEVGAGGRFDVTNIVQPLVSVVTSVGLDHTATLGPSIAQIAWHKAGIIKPGATAITAVTDPVALAPLEAKAESAGVALRRIDPNRLIEIVALGPSGTEWRLRGDEDGSTTVYRSRQPGRFQAVNGTIAVATVRALASHGFPVSQEAVSAGLAAARMPGRLERMPVFVGPQVIVDAAHNADKVRALVGSLPILLGDVPGERPVLLLGAISGKAVAEMARIIAPVVSAVVTTTVHVTGKHAIAAEDMAGAVAESGFSGSVEARADPGLAVEVAMRLAEARGSGVLVSGSLYLGGRVRGRWYPDDSILCQRTPWPKSQEIGANLVE